MSVNTHPEIARELARARQRDFLATSNQLRLGAQQTAAREAKRSVRRRHPLRDVMSALHAAAPRP
jgi:hypothetical protein